MKQKSEAVDYATFCILKYLVMITIVLIFVVTFIIAYVDWGEDSFFSKFLASFLMAMLASLIGIGLAFLITFFLPKETTYATLNLVSTKDNSTISGRFYMGRGRIDGTTMFSFYYKTGDYYRIANAPSSKSRITYTYSTPKVVIKKEAPDFTRWYSHFGLYIEDNSKEYTFYIPEGSIKEDFNLDAE